MDNRDIIIEKKNLIDDLPKEKIEIQKKRIADLKSIISLDFEEFDEMFELPPIGFFLY